MFIWFWKEYIRILPTITCPDIMFSLQDLAIHLFEGARVTWRLKAAHMEDRPIQEIRRRYSGQTIASWNGMIDGAQWVPYQEANFVTPPFADFPSGHSHFSKAFALTMNKWFSTNITKISTYYDEQTLICPLFKTNQTNTYGNFVIPKESSGIQPTVPSVPITLTFNKWNDMADQAGLSRLYGGIHAITAHQSSQQTAILVDGFINATWAISTSNLPTPFLSSPLATALSPLPPAKQIKSSASLALGPTTTVDPYTIQINYLGAKPTQEIQNLINTSKQFLENVIKQSHRLRVKEISSAYDMIVDLDIKPLPINILASARPTIVNVTISPAKPLRQYIILNSNRFNKSSLLGTVEFNNTIVPRLIPVMIHEMLHGMGIASLQNNILTVGWDQFLDKGKTWYTGPNNDWTKSEAIKAYREIVGTHVTRIPVENSFGQGTAYSHWEEGVRERFVKESRFFNYGAGNVLHPALPDEIMTGVAGSRFYFTKLTSGALADHGYTVNTDSENIVQYPQNLIQKP
jgi:hypothetical protein